MVISIHIYVIQKLLLLNSKNNNININTSNFILLCITIGISCYGYGYHNVIAPADLMVNFGESTQTVSYGGNYCHYFHEFVAHKIQYGGIFLFYVFILNIIESKLSNNKNKEKYLKQFLNTSFSIKYILMSSFHGLALGALFAALDMEIVIITFCFYS